MSLLEFISFPLIGDQDGSLVAIEAERNVSFIIKRIYYIFSVQAGVTRGFHAHRNLKQVVICLSGRCRIVLDNGSQRQETWLDSPTKGLVIDDLVWREMHDFSEGCVLLVLASEYYDEADYIRNYDEFLGIV